MLILFLITLIFGRGIIINISLKNLLLIKNSSKCQGSTIYTALSVLLINFSSFIGINEPGQNFPNFPLDYGRNFLDYGRHFSDFVSK